jgi:radical SAM superfamily enzyme YgiQ (UPF0313 family)
MALAGWPVLFVMAPGGATRYFPEQLGTAFLRTVLRRAGIDSSQYLPQRNPSLSGFADFLSKSRPPVVGFTVYEANINVSRAMVHVTRQTLPSSVIAVGGPNATFTPDETLGLLGADVCLRGAGEGKIVSLVQRILGSDSVSRKFPDLLRDVPNLVLRTPDGNHHTPSEDLSSFPAKYFATLDDIPSPFQNDVVSTADIGYLTARGCNQHCTYCSFAALSGRRVAFHSVERVLDDLAALEALAIRTPRRHADIWILDDAFTLIPERARRICEGIIQRGIRLPFRCETRGDRVTPDLLRLMRRAGFVGIAFGLESAVPRVLRAIGKVCPPSLAGDPNFEREKQYLARFRSAVESAQQCGLDVSICIMGGLPGETVKDFQKTLEFVTALKVGVYAHNVLSLFPGTPLHEQRRNFGLDAFRESRTMIWRTVHAYAVNEIRPLNNSNLHRSRWNAAQALSDALCGRRGGVEANEHCVWAVVIHGYPRSQRLAAWLRRILVINGSVIAFGRSRAAAAEWSAFLTESGVPFGNLGVLVPDASAQKTSFDVLGSVGEHHVQFLSTCSANLASAPVEVDEEGNCRISIWLASVPDTQIVFHPEWDCPLVGPGLQVADSCRLWNAPPRCQRPQVLHVDSEGALRACWYGPMIGNVGDELTEIASRNRVVPVLGEAPASAGRSARCPLAPPRGMSDDTRSRLWDLDLASRLSWIFNVGRSVDSVVGTEERRRSAHD